MSREFVKQKSKKKWMAFFAFLTLLALASGFFIYQEYINKEKRNTLISSQFSSVYARLNAWMNERKTRLDRNLAQVRQLAANTRNTHQEIHFEFYSALPNMRISVPENPVIAPDNIFDASQLQRALKNEFIRTSANQYVLQLGIFKNAEGAEKFRSSFARSGYSARVVKFAIAKGIAYSVQAGPFQTKNQALLTQRQLQKKNVTSILRKLES